MSERLSSIDPLEDDSLSRKCLLDQVEHSGPGSKYDTRSHDERNKLASKMRVVLPFDRIFCRSQQPISA
jgi:hypothetical protein